MSNHIFYLFSEIVRLVFLVFILIILLVNIRKYDIRSNKGCRFIVVGLILVKLGTLTDIIGDVSVNLENYYLHTIFESIVGYLLGLIFISIGLIKWLPELGLLNSTALSISNTHSKIKNKINRELKIPLTDNTQEYKKNFLSNLENQLKEETRTITNYVEFILNTEISTTHKEYLQETILSTDKLAFISNSIKELNNISSEEYLVSEGLIDIKELKEELLRKYQEIINYKHLYVTITIDKRITNTYKGPKKELYTIVSKFIENSIANLPQKTMDSSDYIRVEIYPGAAYGSFSNLHFQVTDTGSPIPEKFLEVFNNYSLNILPEEKNLRYGIGMEISSKLLHMVGGNLDIKKTTVKDIVVTDISIPVRV